MRGEPFRPMLINQTDRRGEQKEGAEQAERMWTVCEGYQAWVDSGLQAEYPPCWFMGSTLMSNVSLDDSPHEPPPP